MLACFDLFELQENPVITSLNTTSLKVDEVQFPAITICGQGLIKEVVKSAIFKQFTGYVEDKGNLTAVDNMTQSEKETEYKVK